MFSEQIELISQCQFKLDSKTPKKPNQLYFKKPEPK